MNKKYSAFTIIELTIVMILTAIISSSIIYLWLSTSRSFRDWATFQQNSLDIKTTHLLLLDESEKSDWIQFSDSTLMFLGDSMNVYFKVSNNYLIRNGIDTLLKSKVDLDVSNNIEQEQLIDSFGLVFIEEEVSISILKNYSCHQLQSFKSANTDK